MRVNWYIGGRGEVAQPSIVKTLKQSGTRCGQVANGGAQHPLPRWSGRSGGFLEFSTDGLGFRGLEILLSSLAVGLRSGHVCHGECQCQPLQMRSYHVPKKTQLPSPSQNEPMLHTLGALSFKCSSGSSRRGVRGGDGSCRQEMWRAVFHQPGVDVHALLLYSLSLSLFLRPCVCVCLW